MKKLLLVLVALMLLALPAFAQVKETHGMKGGKPYFSASQKVTGTATVLAVNKSTRDVTMMNEEGDTVTVKAGPAVKNFAQIQKGDMVKISYTEKLDIMVGPPGEPATTTETSTAQAKPGEKPSASVMQKTTYTASITAIDTTAKTVTLKGGNGEEHVVTPRNPANLKKVKVGDMVTITYTEGLAASVEKVTKKK
ncbi:MAG TPA: hypothetical protein VLV15_08255 [Dongiaceae bacterium]|nr:hypothetical protein [Dongiaceae bacterium]